MRYISIVYTVIKKFTIQQLFFFVKRILIKRKYNC